MSIKLYNKYLENLDSRYAMNDALMDLGQTRPSDSSQGLPSISGIISSGGHYCHNMAFYEFHDAKIPRLAENGVAFIISSPEETDARVAFHIS